MKEREFCCWLHGALTFTKGQPSEEQTRYIVAELERTLRGGVLTDAQQRAQIESDQFDAAKAAGMPAPPHL